MSYVLRRYSKIVGALGLETLAQELAFDIAIGVVAPGQDVERALGMAGHHAFLSRYLHVCEQRRPVGQNVAQIGAVGEIRIDRLAPPDTAAEPHHNHIRPGIGGTLLGTGS